MTFDTLIFSHVLEHVRNPAHVVANFCRLLTPGGDLLIAVPNVLFWKQRIRFFLGDFTYESAGTWTVRISGFLLS
jgi:2-polyprenyl-3-methyl-5-hydroxy-6-metoxy-1,4-benzoquinol methylase